MIVNEIIQIAYKIATGDDEALPQGDPSYSKYIDFLNIFQTSWMEERLMVSGERWQSLESNAELRPQTGENYVLLPANARDFTYKPLRQQRIHLFSDKNRILLDNEEFSVVGNKVFFVQNILDKIKSDSNMKVSVPYYHRPLRLTSGNNEVEVDNPNWLIYMLAAEIARTDVLQSGQYGNLVAMAQNEMQHMKGAQRAARIAFECKNMRSSR